MKFIEFDDDLRMKNLAKLTNDIRDNEFMVKIYSNISKIDIDILLPKLQMALKEQGRYLANKKRFKKIKKTNIKKD